MKRVQYHLTEKQVASLRAISSRTGLTVAELIRRAVDLFLKKQEMILWRNAMQLTSFVFEVHGVSPILMNNPAYMADRKSGGTNVKTIPSPEEEAKRSLYRRDDGTLFGPALGFRSGILEASKGRRIGKKSAKTILSGAVFCLNEQVLLYHPKTKKPITDKHYVIDSRRAVIQKTAGIIRSLAKIMEWACDVELEIDSELVDIKVVEEIFQLAGKIVGYLDFRPQRGGFFGRFDVKLK